MIRVTVFLCLLAVPSAWAQQQSPCPDPAFRQFDFWVGEWDVYSAGKLVGRNRIEKIMDGCALQEHWQGATGTKGTSLNYYNPNTKKWNQNWIYQNGTPLPLLSGGFADGKMTLSGSWTGKDGKTKIEKITWTANEDGSVRQLWQQSSDGGKTWQVAFDGHYRKKK